ncbi:hypothetical protein U1Q18_038208 [Sarracenia purpurea var. burkii]
MHHLVGKSNILVDAGPEIEGTDHMPVCPKPRRLGSAIPDFLSPLGSSTTRHRQPNTHERSGILNMIAEKTIDGREAACAGCPPSYLPGSPPDRTDNPIVHDVQFIHQMELFSPFARAKLSDKFGFASASPA